MKVFVTGATGVLGSRAVAALLAAGHDVTGLARRRESADLLAAAGATPVTASLFDRRALARAMGGHGAVCNLATHIPPVARAARRSAWTENTHIRIQGSAAVSGAAADAEVSVLVQESLGFAHGEHGDRELDGRQALAAGSVGGPAAIAERNTAGFAHGDPARRAVALRFGLVMAPESDLSALVLAAARRGVLALPGAPEAWIGIVHADDAAAAVVAALAAPGGAYPVTARAATRREVAVALGDVVGRPVRVLPRAARRAVDAANAELAASQRVTTDRFAAGTAWSPRHPTVRDVFAALVDVH